MTPQIVSRDEWLAARKALLAKERELTHARDRLNAERRALPWVRVEKDYVFQSKDGPRTLADLFQGRSQLLVQHFMLPPDTGHLCPGCSGTADGVDAARRHFENADLSFVAISRGTVGQIEAAKKRMGWTFEWVSSNGSSFNYDYGVAFTKEQIDRGEPLYNYGTTPYLMEDIHGQSVFARNDRGEVFHTYSAYARGAESLFSAFNFLDLVPKGRNEDGTMSWVRLHDEYDNASTPGCCSAAG